VKSGFPWRNRFLLTLVDFAQRVVVFNLTLDLAINGKSPTRGTLKFIGC
jgi:hypothetical protein